ncbi:MAG: MTH938/NDUFAF3 family protein [candidate division KSB1 bacterium]|nr:MTH938/NDUFAF3 family protein [candidate division KSB1 bacterium]
MKITDYSFGRIVIGDKEYRADVIVDNHSVRPNWWRKEGHKLQLEDLQQVIEEVAPEVVVVGKGKFGMMRVSPEVERYLAEKGIELQAAPTAAAVEEFNRLVDKRRVLGAFHLTC